MYRRFWFAFGLIQRNPILLGCSGGLTRSASSSAGQKKRIATASIWDSRNGKVFERSGKLLLQIHVMWKMPPSFLQRSSHNHRSLENIWCTSLLPEYPVIFLPLPRWRYGPMANANLFLFVMAFRFCDSRSIRSTGSCQGIQIESNPWWIPQRCNWYPFVKWSKSRVRCCTTLRKARFPRGSSMSSGLSGRVKIIPTVAQIPLFVLGVSNFETFWDNATHWFWKSILLSQTGMNDAQEKASPATRRVLNWWLLYEQRC